MMRKLLILLPAAILSFFSNAQKAELVIPIGHSVEVTSVAYSPDGQYVLTGGMDNTARLWAAQSGQLIKVLKGHNNPVAKVAFSPDGQRMMTLESGAGVALRLWDKEGNPTDTLTDDFAPITAAIFANDSRHILTGHQNGEVRLISLDDPGFPVVRNYPGASRPISALAMDADGRVLAAGKDRTARLYQADGALIKTLTGHGDTINAAAFSPDGSRIATGCDAEQVILWGGAGQQLEKINRHRDKIKSTAFSPDGLYFASASEDGSIFIWDQNGKSQGKAKPFDFGVNDIAWSPDSKFLLAGGAAKDAVLLNLDGEIVRRYGGHSSTVRSVAFSPDGLHLLTGGNAQQVRVWSTDSRIVEAFPITSVYNAPAALTPDGKAVLIADESKTIKLFGLTGKLLQEYKRPNDGSAAFITYAPNGQYLAVGNYAGQISLWAPDGASLGKPIPAHQRAISSLCFSPDGQQLLSGQTGLGGQGATEYAQGSQDIDFSLDPMDRGQPIARWNIAGERIGQLGSSCHLAAYSPDSLLIATDDDGGLKLWAADGKLRQEWKSGAFDATISALAFSPDSKKILVGYQNGLAKLWNIDGTLLQTLTGHSGQVLAAAFSSDGAFAITGSDDNTAKVWDTATGEQVVSLIALDTEDWVAITPRGFFDASPGALEGMYYVSGLEIIALKQLKGRYYKPGLVQKLLGLEREEVTGAAALDTVSLFPEAALDLDGDQLSITLTPRNGGIGEVKVLVNQREVVADANPERQLKITVGLAPHQGLCLPGQENIVSVVTRNAGGWLASQPYTIPWKPTAFVAARGETDNSAPSPAFVSVTDPNLYILCVGTSKYEGQGLSLTFPDKDAQYMKEALESAGNRLLKETTGKVQAHLLNTDPAVAEKAPSKENIRASLREIGRQARAEDILVLYFSGHGITFGAGDDNTFYYLTKDVVSMDLKDDEMRNNYAISVDTLTEWIKGVKALKQVLIFDACNSGRAVKEISSAKKSLNTDQILALDRMKDRTGTYILSGSAANAVSYEASQYGQGLLTFSLLEGMANPEVLLDKKIVDVTRLFQHAIDEVPELAESIGGIQKPEMALPEGGASIYIGMVDETVKIPLARKKPVFINSNFLNLNAGFDDISLNDQMATFFKEITARGPNADIVFIDASKYKEGYQLNGFYTDTGGKISLNGVVVKGGQKVDAFTAEGSKNDMPGLASKVMQAALEVISRTGGE